jgi:hypothetical protein
VTRHIFARWSHYAALPLRIVLGWFVRRARPAKAGRDFGGPGLSGTAKMMVSAGLTPGIVSAAIVGLLEVLRRRSRRPRSVHAMGGPGAGARVHRRRRRRHARHERRVPTGGPRRVRRVGPRGTAAMGAGPDVAGTRVVVASPRLSRLGIEGGLRAVGGRPIAHTAAGLSALPPKRRRLLDSDRWCRVAQRAVTPAQTLH